MSTILLGTQPKLGGPIWKQRYKLLLCNHNLESFVRIIEWSNPRLLNIEWEFSPLLRPQLPLGDHSGIATFPEESLSEHWEYRQLSFYKGIGSDQRYNIITYRVQKEKWSILAQRWDEKIIEGSRKMLFELGPKINTDILQMEKDGSSLQENLTEAWK